MLRDLNNTENADDDEVAVTCKGALQIVIIKTGIDCTDVWFV